jgi:hypothetical protein
VEEQNRCSWYPVMTAEPVGQRTPLVTCGTAQHASNSSCPAASCIAAFIKQNKQCNVTEVLVGYSSISKVPGSVNSTSLC